jgi:hypothetical protein
VRLGGVYMVAAVAELMVVGTKVKGKFTYCLPYHDIGTRHLAMGR